MNLTSHDGSIRRPCFWRYRRFWKHSFREVQWCTKKCSVLANWLIPPQQGYKGAFVMEPSTVCWERWPWFTSWGWIKEMILLLTKKNCSPSTKVEQACKEFDKQIEPKKKKPVSIMLRNVKRICNGTVAILIRLKSSAAGRKLLLSVIQSATLMFSQRKKRRNNAFVYGNYHNCSSTKSSTVSVLSVC